ncbi:MAG: hypothetical protein O9346_01815 [Leptospiraceae bacterium]|jgi:hypothetical protein|nr:hypothetical protein [Leptospiraceae bacterium]
MIAREVIFYDKGCINGLTVIQTHESLYIRHSDLVEVLSPSDLELMKSNKDFMQEHLIFDKEEHVISLYKLSAIHDILYSKSTTNKTADHIQKEFLKKITDQVLPYFRSHTQAVGPFKEYDFREVTV